MMKIRGLAIIVYTIQLLTLLFILLAIKQLTVFVYAYYKHTFVMGTVEGSSLPVCSTPKVEVQGLNQARMVRVPYGRHKKLPNKVILVWTPFNGNYNALLEGDATFEYYQCPYRNCVATKNRTVLKSADAILFHQSMFKRSDLPNYRSANQKWIFYYREAPDRFKYDWYSNDNLFNWTMSYRRDSDILANYGEVCQLPREEWELIEKDYLSGKKGEVVWFNSNCASSNNRLQYVNKLSQHINVDIYGKCGTKQCLPSQSAMCYRDILKNYKFYLSFEGASCRDYVTEKLFNVLNYDVVPVVMGYVDYESISPPHSVINVKDFPNPADLAQFLKLVGGNRMLYNAYFQWKGKYKSYLTPWMCSLCEKLHVSGSEWTERNNISGWWDVSHSCWKWENDGFV